MDGAIKPIYDIDGVKDYLVINILNEIIDNKMVDVFWIVTRSFSSWKKTFGKIRCLLSLTST